MKQLPAVPIDTDYVKFGGGLDQITPALSILPGRVVDALNYECGVTGGYPRIDGYERFDGHPSPSAATYFSMRLSSSSPIPVVGEVVTGGTSGATGTVVYSNDLTHATAEIAVYVTSGTFVVEAITGNLGATGTISAAGAVQRGLSTGLEDATALNGAADVRRALIAAVPGSGSILGVQMYKGVLYAFRNNVGATATAMYKSAAGGWTAVALGREIAFTSGGTYVIAEGNTITGATSAATAVITRVVLTSGTFAAGTAAGYLVFASQTGTFQAENLDVGANLNVATIAGNSSAITLSPGGRYEFVNYNFGGSTDTLRIYGCDGVNNAFEFDGTVYVKIRTGMTTDTPKHVAAHKKMLFLSFRASSQNSGIGTPYIWTVVSGASEIAIGDDIVGYLVQPGGVLAIFARNSSFQLSGSSTSDFVLSPISDEVGAIPYTLQNIGVAYGLDDRGIVQYTRTQDFGNFNHDTVSRYAQTYVDTIRPLAIASTVYRSRNQYRIYGSDGTGLIMTVEGRKVVGVMPFEYPVDVTCACAGEDSTGKDVVFFGASNGMVYQADKGSSFDGEVIEAYLRMPFNSIKSPRTRKAYRKCVMEMSAVNYSSFRFNPEFSYGDEDLASHRNQTAEVQGAGAYWDAATSIWETFVWDGRLIQSPEFGIEGTGTNLSLVFYNSSEIDLGHTLQGAIIHYTPRRIQR